MTTNKEFPLYWPDNWPRTERPTSSQFRTSLAGALNNVQDSVRKFSSDSGKKVENVVISSNVTLGMQRPKDPGVSIYFSWDGLQTCIAVDRYTKVEDNLQAIHHCIEAERVKLRHGGLNLVRAAFRGYAALPPPTATKPWRDVLGNCKDVAEATAKRNDLLKTHHPDKGGSADMSADINTAFKQAKKELS